VIRPLSILLIGALAAAVLAGCERKAYPPNVIPPNADAAHPAGTPPSK
jgi:hypothetical protein